MSGMAIQINPQATEAPLSFSPERRLVDVAVIGGAFAGASAALLLKRRNPSWRVAIIEKSAAFDRKVGESTTEVSSRFMMAALGISHHLGHEQLNKQGLRMWFSTGPELEFERCAELGARNNSRLSGYQVDRAVLDEHLLKLAAEAGCEVIRPAKAVQIELRGAGQNRLTIQRGPVSGGEEGAEERDQSAAPHEQIEARWVVDASGRAAVIARKLGLLTPLAEHPVNAIWGRFKGVKDWDGYPMRMRFPAYAKACNTGRQWATNHLAGYGWWCWIIPLKGGDTSIGLVYDKRLFTPPEGANLEERLRAHFLQHPVGREMLSETTLVDRDVRAYSQLPYSVSQVAGDGWVLAGDAAGFLDPFYSPGLDFCSYTAHHACTLIGSALEGAAVDLAESNRRFAFCFRAWFEAIYKDKYYYMGDAELMSAAFILDIAAYHLGPVREVFECSSRFSEFPFGGLAGKFAARGMAFWNRRLANIAQRKKAAGTFGDLNADARLLISGFLPGMSAAVFLLYGLRRWLAAEWRARNLPAAEPASAEARSPVPVAVAS